MKRQDFYFDLPEELIAQDPLEDRSSSRLLILDKKNPVRPVIIFSVRSKITSNRVTAL